jgi:hypothetical protein
MVAKNMYSGCILNNAHRGEVVEMMVLSALGADWKFVGLGWHPWDLQQGSGSERVRIQVKQIAALQLWGRTRNPCLTFGWKKKPPSYFFRDNPGEEIEPEGWFCDVFVFGLHLEDDKDRADQVDPMQWKFLVIPTSDLKPGLNSMLLTKALERWQPVTWPQLAESVELAVEQTRQNSR